MNGRMDELRALAREALAVQDAVNLSGVVLSWGRAIQKLRDCMPGVSTRELNQHPINQLWADKVAHLTNTQTLGGDMITQAYAWAHDMVGR